MPDAKLVANESLQFESTLGFVHPPPPGGDGPMSPGPLTPGSISVVSQPSQKSWAPKQTPGLQKKVYRGPLEISLSAFGCGSCQGASNTAPVFIQPTAQKTHVDGQMVIRQDDAVQEVPVTGVDSANNGAPCTFQVNVKISGAGQTKAHAK